MGNDISKALKAANVVARHFTDFGKLPGESFPTTLTNYSPVPEGMISEIRRRGHKMSGFDGGTSEDLQITITLRYLGHNASIVFGRERAPYGRPAQYRSWVECDNTVVSTGLPVRETYEEIARLPEEQ